MPKGLQIARPIIRLPLAAAIEPLEQRAANEMHIQLAAIVVVRHRVIVQVPEYPSLGPAKKFAGT